MLRLGIIIAFPPVKGTASYLTITAGIAAVNRPSNHGCDGCARLTMPPSGCIVPADSGCGISAQRRTLAQPGGFSSRGRPVPTARWLAHVRQFRFRAARPDGQCHSRARHGCRAGRQERPSRDADGNGGCRHRSVHEVPEIRSATAGLAGPRPLRAFSRSWLDAALRVAAPHRLPGHDNGGDSEFPPVAQPHRRAPGIWRSARNRDHDRASGTGVGQRRRHGAGRADDECALRRRSGRPPDLGRRRRRLPDGRHLPGSDHAGRPSPAREADRPVRR